MQRERKLFVAKAVVVMSAIPVLIWAHEYGPDVGHAGVPGENGTCAQSGCHLGTANDPANKGSVSVRFPDGLSYTPGVTQHWLVTISDPAPTQKAWGFQLAARVSGAPATPAGTFASTDPYTLVMCGDTSVNINTEIQLNFGSPQNCPSSNPLPYIEHSLAGYHHTLGQTGSGTYEFDWTPPATNVGPITVYIAGNAAVGNLTTTGAHIYTATFALSPCSGGSKPVITGVGNAAGGQAGVFPGSYVSIYGTNLAATQGPWDNAVIDGHLPQQLNCVSVTIGGQPAYLSYTLPGSGTTPSQINVVAPNTGPGAMMVQVTSGGTASDPFAVSSQVYGPAFFPWGGKYPVATRLADNSWIGPATLFPGFTTPAKPGDNVILWGTGFGPTNPAPPTGVAVPSDQAYSTGTVTVTVGGTNATVYGAALTPGFAGLYQVAIQIPASTPDGDIPIQASIGGVQSPGNMSITVQH